MTDVRLVWESGALKGWRESAVEPSEGSQLDKPVPGPVQRLPMRRFVAQSCVVESAKPIQVSLYQGEEGVLAEIDALHISAVGEDASQAINELAEQVVHFFHHYESLERDQVVGLAARLREIYQTQFTNRSPRVA